MFQSYLVIGNEVSRRQETKKLAQKYSIDLGLISPDIFTVSPQKTFSRQLASSISIDQIRDLKKHIFEKPLKAKYKFVIIENAQKLTIEAQNALLKVLEEPPNSAIIVMEAESKQGLLPTILSRVVIKRSKQPKTPSSSNPWALEKENLLTALEIIAQVKNPTDWIDEQIQLFYRQLLANLDRETCTSAIWRLAQIIEKFQKTKTVIEANVDSKFALADLIFSLKSFDYPKLK